MLPPPAPPPRQQPRARAPGTTAPEIAIGPRKDITLTGDALDLRELRNVVESSVVWWEQSLARGSVSRAQAARSIGELSHILQSLSQQLAQGQQTVRITTRLPAPRVVAHICQHCGGGNRDAARFCQHCGAPLGGLSKGLSMSRLSVVSASRTDRGRVRGNNEDTLAVMRIALGDSQGAVLGLVADGMGGARAGDYASALAATVVQEQLRAARPPSGDAAWRDLLYRVAVAANARVFAAARAEPERRGMGTTLSLALIVGDRLHTASIGDSRVYLGSSRGVGDEGLPLVQLTSDHSLVARLVDIGQITADEARNHPQRNVLYRTVGTDPTVEVDTRSDQLQRGDRVLICSDGLFNHVLDDEIAQILLSDAAPDTICKQLVDLANARGGRDNISVVLLCIEAET